METKQAASSRVGCVGWALLLILLLTVSNVATFLFTQQIEAPAVFDGLYPLPDHAAQQAAGLRPISVINGHEHLYKREHLDAYLAAAESTGVEKTLFVGSNEFTFLGKSGRKDALYDWSNEVILTTYREMPERIIPFVSVYPRDPEKLDKLKSYVERGARGLKLYSGHSTFYDDPLDDPAMDPVFDYCETARLPVCWHVNLSRYADEFERVLERHPQMIVILPHFGVTFYRPKSPPFRDMQRLLDTYPLLYVDCSFGTRDFLVQGLEMVSSHTEIYKDFFERYQDRIIFGTDMVVTGNPEKTAEWYAAVIRACRDVLEKDRYHFFMAAEAHASAYKPAHNVYGELRGLALSDTILEKVYHENLERLLLTTE